VKAIIAGALFQCLATPCIHGCPQGGNGHLPPPGNWDYEPKISRKPEISLIDLILAMTLLFADMTLTLHKSRVHCSCITQ